MLGLADEILDHRIGKHRAHDSAFFASGILGSGRLVEFFSASEKTSEGGCEASAFKHSDQRADWIDRRKEVGAFH